LCIVVGHPHAVVLALAASCCARTTGRRRGRARAAGCRI
jgi:hypothetical protein